MSEWFRRLILKHTGKDVANKEETKETAKGPWVKVVNVHFDPKDPTKGYFELDWNQEFVNMLGEAGYAGPNSEAIVDLWFNDLCRSVALDAEIGREEG